MTDFVIELIVHQTALWKNLNFLHIVSLLHTHFTNTVRRYADPTEEQSVVMPGRSPQHIISVQKK